MSRYLFALYLALAPLSAVAQKANEAQTEAVSATAQCLALGLPEKWKRLQVIIELSQPLADTGGVLYFVTLPDDRIVPFQPCDPNLPPVKLLQLRNGQAEAERGWTKLVLTMQPDASFGIRYEYPERK